MSDNTGIDTLYTIYHWVSARPLRAFHCFSAASPCLRNSAFVGCGRLGARDGDGGRVSPWILSVPWRRMRSPS
jgi:hypothetical protein